MNRLGLASLLFTVTILSACGVSPRRSYYTPYGGGQGTQGGGQAQGGGGGAAASGDPRSMLEQLNSHLLSQGYAAVGPAVHNSSMPTNGVIAYAIDAQPGACYVAAAMGVPGADLNMVVLDPNGATLTYNVLPDEHPWAFVCPTATGRHLVRIQMARGAGEYYYAVYQGSPQRRVDLATFFGEAREQGPATAQLDAETHQRLQALDQQLGQQQYRRVAEPQGLQLGERQDRHFDVSLQEGTCYTFVTLGGQGARDTDIFLLDGAGNELASDTGVGRDATVQFCPQTSGAYKLRTLMYGGQGALFTAAYVRGQSTPTQPVIATTSTAGAGVEENFRLLDGDMRARGYEGYGESSRGQLSEGERRDFAISLEGGKCYAVLAVGDNGVRDLDLILMDANDRELDRDVETDARPVVRVCPRESGDFKMRVQMYRGAGNFIYAAYRWPRGTRGPFGLSGLIYVRLAEVTQLLSVEGYTPDPDYSPGRGSLRREGQSRSHELNLEQGRCYSILAVGGEGVNDLDAALMRGNTQLAADGTRNAFPSVRHCAEQTGRVTLQVRATSGSGDYFYQVFRQSAP